MGTTFIGENTPADKSAQSLHSISTKTASPTRKMKFPITVTYRQLEAKIYRSQIRGVKYYKAAYRAKGGRVTKTFKKLKEAREAATNGLKEAHQRGDGLASLSTREATKLLAALDLLKDAGHSDPVKVATEYIEAKSILSGDSIIDASQDFQRRRKTITPTPFSKAVEGWLGRQESRVASKTFEVTSKIAERLQGAFQVDCCDLGRAEISLFFDSLKDKSPKWRNHHRYVLRGIIKHAIRNHWTPKDHDLDDLLEDEKAVGKKPEIITPEQFSALLQSATSEVLPMIAIGGFAGARTERNLPLMLGGCDPTGRYLYNIPGAHDGASKDGTPVVQYDTKTGTRKVLAFLHALFRSRYNYNLDGCFCSVLGPKGEKLFISWDGWREGQPGPRMESAVLTVLHIPASERVP